MKKKLIQTKLEESKKLITDYTNQQDPQLTNDSLIDLIPNINYSFNRILISYRIDQNKTYLIKILKNSYITIVITMYILTVVS